MEMKLFGIKFRPMVVALCLLVGIMIGAFALCSCAKVTLKEVKEGFESMGLTENISKTGMSVITTTVLPIKSPVSLQIGVADDTFSLKGN